MKDPLSGIWNIDEHLQWRFFCVRKIIYRNGTFITFKLSDFYKKALYLHIIRRLRPSVWVTILPNFVNVGTR